MSTIPLDPNPPPTHSFIGDYMADTVSIIEGRRPNYGWGGHGMSPHITTVGSANHCTLEAMRAIITDPHDNRAGITPVEWWGMRMETERGPRGFMLQEQFSGIYYSFMVPPAIVALGKLKALGELGVYANVREQLRATYCYWALAGGWKSSRYLSPTASCGEKRSKGRPFVIKHHRSWRSLNDTGCYDLRHPATGKMTRPFPHHTEPDNQMWTLFSHVLGLETSSDPFVQSVMEYAAKQHGLIFGDFRGGLTKDESLLLREHLETGQHSDQLIEWIGPYLPRFPVVIGRGPKGVFFVALKSAGVSTSPITMAKWEESTRYCTFSSPHQWERKHATAGRGVIDIPGAMATTEVLKGGEPYPGFQPVSMNLPYDDPSDLLYLTKFSQAGAISLLPDEPEVPVPDADITIKLETGIKWKMSRAKAQRVANNLQAHIDADEYPSVTGINLLGKAKTAEALRKINRQLG